MDNLGSARININGEQHDKIYYGANGNASGLSMMLQLARKLSINRVLLKRSVIFLAAGASQNSSAGSWYFLNRSFGNGIKIDACVNLDMLGLPSNGFYAYTSSNQDINDLIAELSGTLQPVLPRVVAEEPVASVIISAFLLHTSFVVQDFAGFALILITIPIMTLGDYREVRAQGK